MATDPVSIFSTVDTQNILDRLARIKVGAEIEKVAIPEGTVRQLFAVLEARLPEVGPAIEEIPAGDLTADGIEWVLRATEDAMDARNSFLGAA
jgi:hypothetical protein